MSTDVSSRVHARAGFRPLTEELRVDALDVAGELPAWLAGTLVRVTPSLAETDGRPLMRHWFDGLAMLHAFTFADGRVAYANRMMDHRVVRDDRWRATGFGTDPCRTLGQRVVALFEPTLNDNANVNVTRLGERYLAMTEVPPAVEFDPVTLATRGLVDHDDRLRGALTTAHPHFDRERRELLNFVVSVGRRHSYRLYAQGEHAGARRQLAAIPTRTPGYMHSFALTERHVVLTEVPLRYDLREVMLRDCSLLETMRWEPERGTRLMIVERATGRLVRTVATDAFFAFHHVNAFERDGALCIDIVAWGDPGPIWALMPERLQNPDAHIANFHGFLTRFTVGIDAGPVARERLSDARIEFPRINYGRCSARDYRFAYAVAYDAPDSDWYDAIVKIDVTSGAVERWSEPGCYPGEPVLVAAPDAAAEDAGVVLSVVLDARADRSFLLVLDAASFGELARVQAPHRLPFNFHQEFFA